MTVKEVAKVLGVSDKTIRNHIKKLFPDYTRNGVSTIITEEMFTEIKTSLTKNYSLKLENAFQVISDIDIHDMTLKVIEYHQSKIRELQIKNSGLENRIGMLVHNSKTYTATEIAKELNLKSAVELNRKLEEKGIQYKVNNTWVLSAAYSDLGFTSIKQDETENGTIIYNRHWTGKGRDFLLSLFMGR